MAETTNEGRTLSQAEALDKIRKLLAVAQDAGATPGEAEAALGRAAHLQRLAGLTDEQVRRHVTRDAGNRGGINIDPAAVRQETLYEFSRIGRWQAWTASACTKAVGCATYHTRGRIVAYGLPTDLAVARELFSFAMLAGEKATRVWAVEHATTASSPAAKSFRDGFCRGLHDAAGRACEAARRDETPVDVAIGGGAADLAAGSYALVPVTSAALVVATAHAVATYRATKLNLRSGGGYSGRAGGSCSAAEAGRAAGARTSLGRGALR